MLTEIMGGGVARDMEDVFVAKSMQIWGRREGIGIPPVLLKYVVKYAELAFGLFMGNDSRVLECWRNPLYVVGFAGA